MNYNGKPFLLNVSGPYAVGKDTFLNELLSTYSSQVYRVRTITTRPVLQNVDPSYEGVTFEEFEQRISTGRWMVNYQLSGTVAYGTSVDEIEEKGRDGLVCVHSIFAGSDGAGKLREIFGRNVFSIGLLATSGDVSSQLEVLRERLISRGRDTPETIEIRLQHQVQPLEYVINNPSIITPHGKMKVFDETVINENLENTIQNMFHIFEEIFLER
jgi:guanylate kinase